MRSVEHNVWCSCVSYRPNAASTCIKAERQKWEIWKMTDQSAAVIKVSSFHVVHSMSIEQSHWAVTRIPSCFCQVEGTGSRFHSCALQADRLRGGVDLSALRDVYGVVAVAGCWFHYVQATLKRLQKQCRSLHRPTASDITQWLDDIRTALSTDVPMVLLPLLYFLLFSNGIAVVFTSGSVTYLFVIFMPFSLVRHFPSPRHCFSSVRRHFPGLPLSVHPVEAHQRTVCSLSKLCRRYQRNVLQHAEV